MRIAATLVIAIASGVMALGSAQATGHLAANRVVQGADVSWPNCPRGEGIPQRRSKGEPLPTKAAQFVIVGLTNGPGFHPNPCLAGQLQWTRTHHRLIAAYAMTTYPTKRQLAAHETRGPFDSSTPTGRLNNAGAAEAAFNIATMRRLGLSVPMVWVDVEPYPHFPWTSSHSTNRAIVTGAIDGYRRAGLRVGIYTYASGWHEVVGNWRLRNLPTWKTVGDANQSVALHACGHGPSSGRTWIVQWWNASKRDFDVTCPAAKIRVAVWTSRTA